MNELNNVLKRIQNLMLERNWTLYKLAQESGIPYSSLNSLFNKNNQPTISTLEKIVSGFHMSMAEFFSDQPPYRQIDNYTEDEKQLILKYQLLSKKNKVLLSAFADLLQTLDIPKS